MSRANGRIILIEFNELTPSLMSRFIEDGHLPHFRRFRDESHIYVTDAEEEGENLNPWVQWVTVHTALSAAQHGITRLSDGYRLQTKAVWDLLSEAGLRVWVCGSMNARYDKPLKGLLLPDPWSTGLSPYPSEMAAFYDFVRHAVQEHSNPEAGSPRRMAIRFVKYMLRHGLSFETIRLIAAQLWEEKRRGKNSWKRAIILDRIQWDLFRYYYRRFQPQFATFFLNSTAHFQHSYWRHMQPELFTVQPSEEERREYGGAILEGYRNMDELMGRFMSMAGTDATLIFCTALSQQPYLRSEETGGRRYYRVQGPDVLRHDVGITDRFEYRPVMSSQAILGFDGEAAAARAQHCLMSYRCGERSAFHVMREGFEVILQCNRTDQVPSDAVLESNDTGKTIPFYDVFYSMNIMKSGFHHPDGILWVRYPNREHFIHDKKGLPSFDCTGDPTNI